MIRSVMLLASAAALLASPALAEQPAKPASAATPVAAQASAPRAEAEQTQAGPAATTMRDQCSRENPFIEYRDCVNASTRDKNAKVRLG